MKRYKNQKELLTAFFKGEMLGRTGALYIDYNSLRHGAYGAPIGERVMVNDNPVYILRSHMPKIRLGAWEDTVANTQIRGVKIFFTHGSHLNVDNCLEEKGHKLVPWISLDRKNLPSSIAVARQSIRKNRILSNWAIGVEEFYDFLQTLTKAFYNIIFMHENISGYTCLAKDLGVEFGTSAYWSKVFISKDEIHKLSWILSFRHDIQKHKIGVAKNINYKKLLKAFDEVATFMTMYRLTRKDIEEV